MRAGNTLVTVGVCACAELARNNKALTRAVVSQLALEIEGRKQEKSVADKAIKEGISRAKQRLIAQP